MFNRRATVGDAMDSLRAQRFGDVEHIVQDGGSTDGTLEVLQPYLSENTKLVSAPDGGIYDAINRGIARTTGEIVGLMHSDDFFADDEVLSRVAEAMEDPALDGVYGDLDYVAAGDTSRIIRRWRSGGYTSARLKRGWMPPTPRCTCVGKSLTNGGSMTRAFALPLITMRCCAIWRGGRSGSAIFPM
ncbi:glycosyltransferase [Roseobacteraceae bacterium S113]